MNYKKIPTCAGKRLVTSKEKEKKNNGISPLYICMQSPISTQKEFHVLDMYQPLQFEIAMYGLEEHMGG